MAKKATRSKPQKNVVFLPGLYNDTVALLLASYEYFQENGVEDQMSIPASRRTAYTCEMSRISMRLTAIMAWIMIRKAVLQGKMTEKEANEKFQFDTKDLCLAQDIEAEHILPVEMKKLLGESLQLYERVVRLDKQMRGSTSKKK